MALLCGRAIWDKKQSSHCVNGMAIAISSIMNTTDFHAVPTDGAALRQRRVLVVDDNADSADTLALLIEMLGAEVHIARNGPAALAELAAFRADDVLLDIGMPGMDGYEVARRIRSQPCFDAVRLIALTGWSEEEDVQRARASGFDHHLAKPVDLDALHAVLLQA